MTVITGTDGSSRGSPAASEFLVLERSPEAVTRAAAPAGVGFAMMVHIEPAVELRQALRTAADPTKAAALQRYFREPIASLGVPNAKVEAIAAVAVARSGMSPGQRLALAEELITAAECHEELILAFALVRKVVKRYPGDDLLDTFERWLRVGVSNWAQCDDLCLKVIYEFLLGHPELIRRVADWTKSDAPWVRRAGNVALVKFVRRRIGSATYHLPIEIVLENADRLLDDPDVYVRKSTGWLLKVAAAEDPDAVVGYLADRVTQMDRGTFRNALEGVDPDVRRSMMALRRNG